MAVANPLSYIRDKFNLDVSHHQRLPIEIPNTGRDELACLLGELGYRVGVEIGVERGLFSEKLCYANPGVKLYCVDPWTAYPGYREHVTQDKLDEFYLETRQRLASYNAIPVRRFSQEAVDLFELGSLDFVYIDANHEFKNVVDDIAEWSARVRSGGIVAGHDYRHSKQNGYRNHVIEAVQGYTQAYQIRPWFVLGAKEKRPDEIRDDSRSWFWVKP